MDEHLGYAKHDPAGAGSGNSRNGKRAKTVVTEVGPVDIDVGTLGEVFEDQRHVVWTVHR